MKGRRKRKAAAGRHAAATGQPVRRRGPVDGRLRTCVLLLVLFGLVMVYSASSVLSLAHFGSSTAYFTSQLSKALCPEWDGGSLCWDGLGGMLLAESGELLHLVIVFVSKLIRHSSQCHDRRTSHDTRRVCQRHEQASHEVQARTPLESPRPASLDLTWHRGTT